MQRLVAAKNAAEETGRLHVVLIDSVSKKSSRAWAGRADNNKKVFIDPCSSFVFEEQEVVSF